MSYKDIVMQDQRLTILQILSHDCDYSHNENVIQSALAHMGHKIGIDLLRTHCGWLNEQGLVDINEVVTTWVIKLTHRGLDVANGHAIQPGVARVRP